jgi:hypothetical protein
MPMGRENTNSEYWKNLMPLFNGIDSILFRTKSMQTVSDKRITESWVGVWQNSDGNNYDIKRYTKTFDIERNSTHYGINSVSKAVDLHTALRTCLEHESLKGYTSSTRVIEDSITAQGSLHFSEFAIQNGITLADLHALQQKEESTEEELSRLLKKVLEKQYGEVFERVYNKSPYTDNTFLAGLSLAGVLGAAAAAGLGAAYGYNAGKTKGRVYRKRRSNIYSKTEQKKRLDYYINDLNKYRYDDENYRELNKEILKKYKSRFKKLR